MKCCFACCLLYFYYVLDETRVCEVQRDFWLTAKTSRTRFWWNHFRLEDDELENCRPIERLLVYYFAHFYFEIALNKKRWKSRFLVFNCFESFCDISDRDSLQWE
jgi:hypothetical protein